MHRSDSIKRVGILAALVGCCLVASWNLWSQVARWNQRRLITQLTAEIETASDERVRIPLRQLASLGTPALYSLVEASVSERTSVAELARRIIDEQFDSWQLQAKLNRRFDKVSPAVALADALASHIEQYGPRGKHWAAGMALRLIVMTDAVPADKAPEILADCTRILDSVPAKGPRFRNVPTTILQEPFPFRQAPALPSVPLATFAVPSESVICVPTSTANAPEPLASTLTIEPSSIFANSRLADRSEEAPPSRWSSEWSADNTNKLFAGNTEAVPVQPIAPLSPVIDNPPTISHGRVVDIPSPAEMGQQTKRLRQKTSPELVRLLSRGDIFETGPIRAVLRERGLTETEMNLESQFTSTQIGDRLQFIENLSVLPASTARRWLHWLLEDKSAEVRFRALSAIATTADPTLFEVARHLAVTDEDSRVVRLATRIMRDAR